LAASTPNSAPAHEPSQFHCALVELVVADDADVEDVVHRLDGRLVVVPAGDHRAAADQVPGRDDDRIGVLRLRPGEMRSQVGSTPGRPVAAAVRGAGGRADAQTVGFEVAMEIVDGENLGVHHPGIGGLAMGERGHRQDHRGDGDRGAEQSRDADVAGPPVPANLTA
jgi:hypothetical protein